MYIINTAQQACIVTKLGYTYVYILTRKCQVSDAILKMML